MDKDEHEVLMHLADAWNKFLSLTGNRTDDVQNADTESSAREKAFAIMSAANAQPARGRTPSGPKASVTGIAIEDNRFDGKMAAPAWNQTPVNREFTPTSEVTE